MRSRNGLYSFEESKTIIYWLCEMARVPVPTVKLIDTVGYLGEQFGLEIRLRQENDMETIVHEWLHYLFTLVWLEKLHWQNGEDKDDDLEHRIVLFLEPILGSALEKLYKSAKKKNRRGK